MPADSDPDPWADAGRWLDRAWYLTRNPDVARVGIEPLAHYLRYGEQEGRKPSPWFDPLWYRATYGVPPGECALAHFLTRRRSGAFLPSAALYPAAHLPAGREAVAEGADPFDRYLNAMQLPERELLPELAIIRSSGLIGADYHTANDTGPYESEIDPVLHYCRIGWRRRFKPNAIFDLAWYEETNPAVARLRINPLSHYILEGEPFNRRPVLWFDPVWYRTEYAVTDGRLALAHYLTHRHTGTFSPNPLFDATWYVSRHGATIPLGIDPFTHYLFHGAMQDIDPSPRFDARLWRHRHMAPLTAASQFELPLIARNPLVHHLCATLGMK